MSKLGAAFLFCTISAWCPCAQAGASDCVSEVQDVSDQSLGLLCKANKKEAVLYQLMTGKAAFAEGRSDVAAVQFDKAIDSISRVFSNSDAATRARASRNEGGEDEYLGEPYERVMAYYYRGLLHLKAGVWGAAFDSFQEGVLQNSFDSSIKWRASIASLIWLSGWAKSCGGNKGEAHEFFEYASALHTGLSVPQPDDKILIVAEAGNGPRKVAEGDGNRQLTYIEGMSGNDALVVDLDGVHRRMMLAEDLFLLATSRGGIQDDKLISTKAGSSAGGSFVPDKSTLMRTAIYGRNASIAPDPETGISPSGAVAKNIRGVADAAVAAGMFLHAARAWSNTPADTRTWDSLPHSIFLTTMPTPPYGVQVGKFKLFDGGGNSVLTDVKGVQAASAGSCSLIWVGKESIQPSMTNRRNPPTDQQRDFTSERCQVPLGAIRPLTRDVCERIGGTPLQ